MGVSKDSSFITQKACISQHVLSQQLCPRHMIKITDIQYAKREYNIPLSEQFISDFKVII